MDNKHPQAAECTPGKMSKVTRRGRNRDRCQTQVSLSSVAQDSLSVWGMRVQRTSLFVFLYLCSHLPIHMHGAIQQADPFVLNIPCLYFSCFHHPQPCQSPVIPQNWALGVSCRGAPSGCRSGLGPLPSYCSCSVHWGLRSLKARTASCFCFCFSCILDTERGLVDMQGHLHGSIINGINE